MYIIFGRAKQLRSKTNSRWGWWREGRREVIVLIFSTFFFTNSATKSPLPIGAPRYSKFPCVMNFIVSGNGERSQLWAEELISSYLDKIKARPILAASSWTKARAKFRQIASDHGSVHGSS